MDNYQYRLLQLSIPTRTTAKEQEAFLREIYEKHIDVDFLYEVPFNVVELFTEAYNFYTAELPDYILATVHDIRKYHLTGKII